MPLLMVLWAPTLTSAQQPVATRSGASRGIAWGAAVGGALGGLGVGVLSSGLCDSADCDGSFGEGFIVGLLAGAAAGGVTGLVLGSAFPIDGGSLGGTSWTVQGGVRQAVGADDINGAGAAAGLRLLRATTERIWFGVALEYLGRASHRDTFEIRTRDGTVDATTLREWHISSLRFVAARSMGTTSRSGAYLLAGAGVYPTWERSTFTRFGDPAEPREATESSFVAAPGIGAGAGYLVDLAADWSLDLGARWDVVAGISSDAFASIFQVTMGLRRGNRRAAG